MRNKILILVLAPILVFSACAITAAHNGVNGYGMMGPDFRGDYDYYRERYGNGRGYNGMMGYGGMMGMMGMMMGPGMMGEYGWGYNGPNNYDPATTDLSEDEIKNRVLDFVNREFGSGYEIGDIFIFANSPYYISIVEKETGQGAFELLFDPYRNTIYPEHGPNMMWNQKYGIMVWGNPDTDEQLDWDKALEQARQFVKARNTDLTVENEGHKFYGYYTFHTAYNGKTEGMLSVNAYTGDVWYHNWHGQLDRIVETGGHEEN